MECLRNQFNMQTNVQKPLRNNRNHVTSWNLSTSKGTKLINVNSFDEPLHCNEWRALLPKETCKKKNLHCDLEIGSDYLENSAAMIIKYLYRFGLGLRGW